MNAFADALRRNRTGILCVAGATGVVSYLAQNAQAVIQPVTRSPSISEVAQGVAIVLGNAEEQLTQGVGWAMQQITNQPFDIAHAGPYLVLAVAVTATVGAALWSLKGSYRTKN